MALIVEDGTAKSDAEAFASVAQADAYLLLRGNPTEWNTLATDVKEQFLREGADWMEEEWRGQWKGHAVDEDQRLSWPRHGVVDANFFTLDSDIVPEKVRNANIEAALRRAKSNTLNPDLTQDALLSEKTSIVGPLRKTEKYVAGSSPTKQFPKIRDIVDEFLKSPNQLIRA